MGFFLRFISKEIDSLNSRLERNQVLLDDVVKALADAKTEIKELKTELKAERKAKDAVVYRYGDLAAHSLNATPVLARDVAKAVKEPEPPPPPDTFPDERIKWAAAQLRNSDLEDGGDVAPLSTYITRVRETGVDNLL